MEVDKQRIAELVSKLQNGEDSDFDELYKLTSDRAYFVALEFTKNKQDAEDILQESYMKALSKINELDKPESFSSWLNQIVANKSKDFLKKKKPMLFNSDEEETNTTELLHDEDTSFSPEENLDQTELQKAVMEVLDELSEEKRACVMMMYFEELSVGEIAETLEIPEGTVKTRLFSARKDLKDKFAKKGITSAYSIAPIGVVIWALRRMSDAVSKTFVGTGASAKVLAGITVAGTGTAASVAVASTTAATTAAAVGTGTATAAATGTGIAAKIAALTVAQKVIAGVSVAAVVAGSAAGVVTVANNNDKKDDISTTAYTEEYTTAPSFETTLAVDALGTVEFSETTELSSEESTSSSSTSKNSTTQKQITSQNATSATKIQTTTKVRTTRRTTTRRDYSLYNSATTSAPETVTTTKEETTTHPRSMTTTTVKQTTTTKPTTTTTKPTTTKATTTKPDIYTTSSTQNVTDSIIIITYQVEGETEKHTLSPIKVLPGTVIDDQLIYDFVMNDSSLGFSDAVVYSGDYTSSSEAGKTYKFMVYTSYEE